MYIELSLFILHGPVEPEHTWIYHDLSRGLLSQIYVHGIIMIYPGPVEPELQGIIMINPGPVEPEQCTWNYHDLSWTC